MKNQPTQNGTATLRALINKMRRQGQWIEPLVLARLGAQYCRQAKGIKKYDEISHTVFNRYLEIMPDDKQVREAQAQLASLSGMRMKYLQGRSARLLIIISSLAIVGVIHHYTTSSSLQASKISIVAETQSSAVIVPSSEAEPIIDTENKDIQTVKTPITIRAVGDIVLGNNYPALKLPGKDDMARITALQQTLGNADIVLGNLEGVLLDKGESRKNIKLPGVYSFRMPENFALILKKMGFDVLSLANNHALDFGQKGLKSTIKNLDQQGIKSIGVPNNQVAFIQVRNTTVAFLAYSYISSLNYMGNQKQIQKDIQNAMAGADLVMVSVHAGKEGNIAVGAPTGDEYFLGEYRGNILKFSEYVIDSGASAVFGHGPHIVRPYKLYKGKPVFFSLGNFIGYRALSTRGQLGHSVIADLSFNADGELIEAGVIPLKLDKLGIPRVDYSPANLKILDTLLDNSLDKSPVLNLNHRIQDAS